MAWIIAWGYGAAASALIREAEETTYSQQEALRCGWNPDQAEAWAVEIDAPESEVDAATRADPAVRGWFVAGTEEEIHG